MYKRIVPAFYPAGSNVHFSYRLLLLCGASRQFIFLNEIPLNCLPGEQNPPQIGLNLLSLHSAELTFSTHTFVLSNIRKGFNEIWFHFPCLVALYEGGFSNVFKLQTLLHQDIQHEVLLKILILYHFYFEI